MNKTEQGYWGIIFTLLIIILILADLVVKDIKPPVYKPIDAIGWRLTPGFRDAISSVESSNNDYVVNQKEQAYGRYQIRQCVIDDVNERFGTHFQLSDAFHLVKAQIIMEAWFEIVKPKSNEEAARMWNSGRDMKGTDNYWRKINEYDARASR